MDKYSGNVFNVKVTSLVNPCHETLCIEFIVCELIGIYTEMTNIGVYRET